MSLSNIPQREQIIGRGVLCLNLLIVAGFILTRLLAMAVPPPPAPPPDPVVAPAPAPPPPDKVELPIALQRGELTLTEFPSKKEQTAALILFGSGDGGWDTVEEAMAHALQNEGYEVIAINSPDYAKTDYDLSILQSDYTKIAQTAAAPFGDHAPPLIFGGYSMGAEQAIAAAGGPHPSPGLVGLLLVSPERRGRYGLRAMDKIDIPPTGPGTFSMKDFAKTLDKLRVAQWHGGYDPTDSVAWLTSLTAIHKEFDFPNVWHNYDSACPEFLRQLTASVGWILNLPASQTEVEKSKNTP